MIWGIPLCYSKLALPPTHAVSAKNFGLGLSVIEVSKSGSKENYIHPPCSPLCVLLPALLGQGAEKSGIQELIFPCTNTYTDMHRYIWFHCPCPGSGKQHRACSLVSEHNNIFVLATMVFITAFCQITGLSSLEVFLWTLFQIQSPKEYFETYQS